MILSSVVCVCRTCITSTFLKHPSIGDVLILLFTSSYSSYFRSGGTWLDSQRITTLKHFPKIDII